MSSNLVPTAKLRFVKRDTRSAEERERQERDGVANFTCRILQQWWAEPMPSYMRDHAMGEWRDVELVEDVPA